MDSQTRKWVDIALEDYEVAKLTYSNNRFVYSLFMCQQALEKMIKAVYQETYEKVPPRKHDLISLFIAARLGDQLDGDLSELLSVLTQCYIESRYPEYKDRMTGFATKENCRNCLEKTREVLEWLKNMLK